MSEIREKNVFQRIKNRLKPFYLPFVHKYKYRRDNKAFNNFGNEVLLRAKKVLDEIGVHFWLDYGTLLGVYRDGKLIGHDTDVDIAVFLKDYSPEIEKAFIKHGFTYERKIVIDEGRYGMEQSFSYKNVKLDIFYYTKKDTKCISHIFPLNKEKEFIVREIYTTYTGFKSLKFLNVNWNIPKNTELRLIETYGENYRIPIKNWYTPDDALNSKIINKDCNEVKY